MIVKKIENPKKSAAKAARIRELVRYITAPEAGGGLEKCIHWEAANFITDALGAQVMEMIALAQESVRSQDPVDHWTISWPEDEKPSIAQAREAVEVLMRQSGLAGHQHVFAVHDDTHCRHLHVVVNRVHPQTFKVIKINQGFYKETGQQVAAIVEKLQGWRSLAAARYRTNDQAELVMDGSTKRPKIFTARDKAKRPTALAQDMEVQTGEKSAQRIGIEQGAPIMAAATSWGELHGKLAQAGMRYERKGSGAILYVGQVPVKASSVDRQASLGALQKRLGAYQGPAETAVDGGQPGAGEGHRAGKDGKDGKGGEERSLPPLNRAPLAAQPMRAGQSGWAEYLVIRDARKAAKNAETLVLRKRQGQERAALLARLRAERQAVLARSWQGQGVLRNAMQSVLAAQQAAQKLELAARQREARKALQARYKPMPMYRQWKEAAQIMGIAIVPAAGPRVISNEPLAAVTAVAAVAQTLRLLTHRVDARQHVTYQLQGADMFRDEGRSIAVLDLASRRGMAAALALAQQRFGNVLTLTGPLAFQHRAVAVAVESGLTCRFSDPALEQLRVRLQGQKYQAQRDEADRAAAGRAALVHKAALAPGPVQEAAALEARVAVAPVAKRSEVQTVDAQKAREEAREEAAEEDVLSERAQLADIERQVAQAKSEAGAGSALHSRPVVQAVEDDYARAVSGASLGSNAAFVAVSIGREIKVYRTEALARALVQYDGLASGCDRFARGNLVEISQGRAGTRITLSEQREAMQDQARRKPGQGVGR
jgi:hypothetical protein